MAGFTTISSHVLIALLKAYFHWPVSLGSKQCRHGVVLLRSVLLSLSLMPSVQAGAPDDSAFKAMSDPGVRFARGVYSAGEMDEFVTVWVVRDQQAADGSVDYEVIGETALAGRDFVAQAGTLTFTSWWQEDNFRILTIPLMDNREADGDRTFLVRLKNSTGGIALAGRLTETRITIQDNDTVAGPAKGFNGEIITSAGLPEGGVIVGGRFRTVNGLSRPHVARLHSDGSLDEAFEAKPDGAVYSLARQPDGKILIGGLFTSVSGVRCGFVARLLPDGKVDPSFRSNPGWEGAMPSYGAGSGEVRSIALQSDGKIVTASSLSNYNGVARFGLARLHPDGSLDDSFRPATQSSVGFFRVAVQPDGKILIHGALLGHNNLYLARLLEDGSIDPTFQRSSVDSPVNFIYTHADGQIWAGTEGWVMYLNGDGSWAPGPINPFFGRARSILPQPDGTFWVGGQFERNGRSLGNLAKVWTDRMVSPLPLHPDNGPINTLAWQGTNIFAGGTFESSYYYQGISAIPRNYHWKQISLLGRLQNTIEFERIVRTEDTTAVSLKGQAPSSAIIERSSNLIDWKPVVTNAAPNAGLSLQFSPPEGLKNEYYRVRSR
jgi:uncharacterized delta-60 repeat protein